MRTSKYVLYTNKKNLNSKICISHQLMLQAGLIRQLSSGLYIWLPTGLRIIKKITNIIRNEMNKIGGLETLFPIMQHENAWKKSNHFYEYGNELIKLYDRNNNCFILTPTYEEIITDFTKQQINSYKKLPIILYQIQSKFRDEIRPRAGIIRSKEFIMKDAYSFHMNKNCLENTYHKMYKAYIKIFNKMQLKFYSIQAKSGIIGGKYSHEFQSISKHGEDKIIVSYVKKHPINIIHKIKKIYKSQNQNIQKTYIQKKILYNTDYKKLKKNILNNLTNIIKIFIVKIDNQFIGLVIRGDHILNIKKIKNIFSDHKILLFANKNEIHAIIQKYKKINLNISFILDTHVIYLKNIIPITIINNILYQQHILNQKFHFIKIKNIIHAKNSENIKKIKIKNTIEIGHIFNVGTKYSKIINFKIKNQKNQQKFIYMGCYGIGVTRLIAAVIEQNYDHQGIIWPINIAPFQLVIIPINNSKNIQTISKKLYYQFQQNNIDVLLEDRKERISTIFSDINLIGIPHIIIINHNTIKFNTVEYQHRSNINSKHIIHINNIIMYIINNIIHHLPKI